MKMLALLPIGAIDTALLQPLAEGLTRRLHTPCSIQPSLPEPKFAFNPQRAQYHSTEILSRIARSSSSGSAKVLALTAHDLYIPVLTYVFGEAQLAGDSALVSTHRLREEFYGMPANRRLLEERLLKESLHELGHTCGLRHCPDFSCVMSSSNGIERVDLKNADFCSECLKTIDPRPAPSAPSRQGGYF